MKLFVDIWYYNRFTDTFLYCAEMMGHKTVQTFSRIEDTDLVQYAPNEDEMDIKDLPYNMLKGYRPFGKIKGKAYLQRENGKTILTIPRAKLFKERIKEVLPTGFNEDVFRKLVYDFPDMLVDTLDPKDIKL